MLSVVVILLLLLLLVDWWRMKPFYWKKKGIPYSVPLPILGNALGQFFNSFSAYWNKKYMSVCKEGGLAGYYTFSRLSLIVTDPKLVKEILVKQSDMFTSRGMHTNPRHDPLARNLFHSSGDEWKKIRTKLTPFFSPSRLKHMTQMMTTNIRDFANQFEKVTDTMKPVNVNELSLKLTTDVVVNTIFGIEPDSFTNPNSFFYSLQEELFGHSFVLKILLGTISPFIYDLFRFTVIGKSTVLKLKGFVEVVMEQRAKNIGVRQDFIQGMIELSQNNSSQPSDGSPKGFSMEEATAQCMVMYLGGTETTGNTLSFLLHELAINQEIQDKVRREINQVLSTTDDSLFMFDRLNELTYTNMVINETLRKYPILPVVTRQCTKSTRVGGVDIEVGTGVFVPIMALHWDPRFYPEPEKFIPERFEAGAHKDNSIYMPFGLGPRTCIGWKMAVVEIAFALCQVLPKFKFLPSNRTKSQIVFNWKPTLNPEGGVWLIVESV